MHQRIMLLLLAPLLYAQDGAVVEGRVTNSVTHAGVDGVEVRIWTNDATHYETTTDAAGGFRITGVQDGNYNARFERTGFVTKESLDIDTGRLLRITGGNMVRLDSEIVPLARVSGRVVDSDGRPVAGAEVDTGAFRSAVTNEEGRFTIESVEPGSYRLRAKPRASGVAPAQSADDERLVPQPTYFPSVIEDSQAERISVAAGADLEGFEIRIRSVPVYRIRGRVLDETGNPLARARVRLAQKTDATPAPGRIVTSIQSYYFLTAGWLPGDETETAADGSFEFPTLRAGEWRVNASWFNSKSLSPMMQGAASVLLERRGIDDLEIRVRAPFVVQTTVEMPDSALKQVPPMSGVLLLSEFGSGLMLNAGSPADSRPPIAPGRYRVAPGPAFFGYYAASVLMGGREVLGADVDLEPDSPPLHIIYRKTSSRVHGSVDNGANAKVWIWPEMDSPANLILDVRCKGDGSFETGALPPGNYLVLALGPASQFSANIVSQKRAQATRVTVDEGQTAAVQLRIAGN